MHAVLSSVQVCTKWKSSLYSESLFLGHAIDSEGLHKIQKVVKAMKNKPTHHNCVKILVRPS